MTTTDGQLYFVAMRSLERLEIQFVPKELILTRDTHTSDISIVGRNNPFYHYTTGVTRLNFELDFHAEEKDRQDVIRKCKWIESLGYNDGYKNPPERVMLVWGDLFRPHELWVVKGVQYRLTMFDKQYGSLPRQAYMNMTLELDPSKNLGLNDVKWSDLAPKPFGPDWYDPTIDRTRGNNIA